MKRKAQFSFVLSLAIAMLSLYGFAFRDWPMIVLIIITGISLGLSARRLLRGNRL